MNPSLRERNRAFLSRYFPALALPAATDSTPRCFEQVERVEGKRGYPVFRVKNGETWSWIHSQYDPRIEAERWAAASAPGMGGVGILVGWGMGYGVLEWIKRHGRTVDALVVVEPEPMFLEQSLDVVDLAGLTQVSCVEIVLGGRGEEVYAACLKHMEYVLTGGIHLDLIPHAALYPKEYVARVEREAERLAATRQQMLQHMNELGPRCQANLIGNIPCMARSLFPRDVRGRLEGEPAIIVAAGPSLDRNKDQLLHAQGKAWILAVDTSYRILHEMGIKPPFVVTKDPTELNMVHFEGLEAAMKPILAYDPQVLPIIPSQFGGRLLCLPNRNHEVHRYLAGLELTPEDELPFSTNVAIAAFNLAAAMGCNPIVFVGLDLCFSSPEGFSHARGSALGSMVEVLEGGAKIAYRRGESRDEAAVLQVEGVDGRWYPTLPTFYEALRLLETLIQASPAECIDATEGGARIAGTTILSLEEVIRTRCLHAIDREAGGLFQPPVRGGEALRRSVQEIAIHVGRCGGLAQQGRERLEQSDPPDLDWCEKMREEIEADFHLYHELQSVLERLVVEIHRRGFWERESTREEALRQRYQWFFSTIEAACENFAPFYAYAAELLPAHEDPVSQS